MIYLEFADPISLHRMNKEARQALIESCRAQLCGQALQRKVYRVEWVLYGPWLRWRNGKLGEANTDNWVKPLADIIAEAGGLGKRGRGDQYLDRDYSVKTVDSDTCKATVTLF